MTFSKKAFISFDPSSKDRCHYTYFGYWTPNSGGSLMEK